MSEETKKTSEEQEAENEIPVTDGDQAEENLTPEGEELPEEETKTPGEEAAPEDKKEEKKTSFFGKKKKDKSEQKVEELTDRLKRTMAEFDNFRKRTEKEKSAQLIFCDISTPKASFNLYQILVFNVNILMENKYSVHGTKVAMS